MTDSDTLSPAAETLRAQRAARARGRAWRTALLAVVVAVLFAASLMIGERFYGPGEVLAVLTGQGSGGAKYAVGHLRLPRATLALLAGAAFGASGVLFQTMLRNQLASPDIIGISSGASAAGVVAILGFHLSQTTVSLWALAGGLATAVVIYLLSSAGGFAGTRLILIGIGVAAILQSVVTYMLSRAAAWDLPTATRWLTGSLNGATWERTVPVAVACVLAAPVLLAGNHRLAVLRLGDDAASALGVRTGAARLTVIVAAVALIAVATSACGPIAFVAFMAGPVAVRLIGPADTHVLPAALVGAVLVLAADLAGQYFLGTRYPAGVITGVLGAPYLLYLLIRTNRSGDAL
ncbi:FecCD family ABC transporter permease [Corynebacterium frankenforstense]